MAETECSVKVLATHVQHFFAQANGGSTNIARDVYHGLLLPFKDYLIMLRVPYLPDI